MNDKQNVTYSLFWKTAPALGALLDDFAACGLPADVFGGGQIVNLSRPSRNPGRSARVIVDLILDEVHAAGVPIPDDIIVFTPADDAEIFYWSR